MTVAKGLNQRIGQTLPEHTAVGQVVLPPETYLDAGISEDAAVTIALWNNATFQDLLVDLGLTRSDLVQAGLLPNPEFIYFFEVPDKPFKYAFDFPLEAIWLRPIRLKIAAHEAERAADRLVQNGLDLMRDVRQAYADVLLAQERLRVAREAVRLRTEIANFAQKRFEAGDISKQEVTTAKIDALQAQQDVIRIGYDTPIAEERLQFLMGVNPLRQGMKLVPGPIPSCQEFQVDMLVKFALESRPDALAAGEFVAAAQARLQFAHLGWVRLLGIGDATSGKNGHEFGPAFRFTVPLFNHNQGGIARAQAELERAERQQQTAVNQIILDVRRAYLQYRQACAELTILRSTVRPEVETAIRRAERAYREGNVNYLIVLEASRQLIDSYLREAVLHGDLRRAWVELERSVGKRLASDGGDNPSTVEIKKSAEKDSGQGEKNGNPSGKDEENDTLPPPRTIKLPTKERERKNTE